jgi:hypothetical protein
VSANAEGMAQLRAALGKEPPPGLATLDEATLVSLAAAIQEAEERQKLALREASDRALRHIPRPLRGPVRKALFG